MKKTEKVVGKYCPKRPGYCWANLPKEDQAAKAARSKPGCRAAKNKAEAKYIKEKILHIPMKQPKKSTGLFFRKKVV